MSFLVYIQDSETGKVVATGAFDEMPLVIAPNGSSFIFLPPSSLDRTQFYKLPH